MHAPQEVEEILKEGASMSAVDAEALEQRLDRRPYDLEARARLLGYYEARGKEAFKATTMQGKISFGPGDSSRRETLARHALWLAGNAPRSPLAAHPLLCFSTREPVYAELSSIWRRQVAVEPPDPRVLANAIAFFWWPNDLYADELLARAEALFPGDRRWMDLRRSRRAEELALLFRSQSLGDRGLLSDADMGARAAERLAAQGLDEIEQLLAEGDPESEWVPRLREIAGQLALGLGRVEIARAHAQEMVMTTGDELEGPSDAVHNGHLLLGRIALGEDDVERARAHLILAGRAGATRMVPIFGPDMRLAAGLLARGEREAVIRYLALCRAFWRRGPADAWSAQIRAGDLPDFGRNLGR